MSSAFTEMVLNEVEKTMQSQDNYGYAKYGKYLDPEDKYDWLQMAQEELADALKYFIAEKYKRNLIKMEILESIDYATMHVDKSEHGVKILKYLTNIKYLLDELVEGR